MTAEDPLLERADEIGLLHGALESAVSIGTGVTLLYEGPAGIGKTSVLAGARAVAESRGLLTVVARGSDLEQDYAWGLVRQLFGQYAQEWTESGDTAPAAAAARALVAGRGGDRAAQGEYALIHSIFWLTSELAAGGGPMLLVVDDLHWADLPSLRFLAYLSARLEGLPVVIVGGLRPGYERVEHIVAAMTDGSGTAPHLLRPFTINATEAMLTRLLPTPPDARMVARCHEATLGNPLLLRELGKQLVGMDQSTGIDGVLERGVPTIARYVGLQQRRLPENARHALQALAVLGDESAPDKLATVAGIAVAEVLDGLTALLASEMVTATDTPQTFSIAHPLIRAAVYDNIPTAHRAELHVRAARAAMSGDEVELAATHLLRVPAKLSDLDAISVLSEAANACLARGSVDGAIAFLRRQLDEDLGESRLELLTRLGMAEVLVDADQARQHLLAAQAMESDVERSAEIALALGGATFFSGQPLEAQRVLQSALDRHPGLSVSSQRALESWIILLTFVTPTGTELIETGERLRALEPDCSFGGRMLEGVLSLNDAFHNRREPARARALRAIADDILISHPIAESPLACAWTTLEACDAPEVLVSLDAAVAHARSAGSVRALSASSCYRSAVMLGLGNLEESVTEGLTAWHASLTSSNRIGLPFGANYLLRALAWRGQFAEGEAILRQFHAMAPSGMPSYIHADGEITFLLARGQVEEAARHIEIARRDCAAYEMNNPLICDWRNHLVMCLHLQARDDEAREVAAQAIEVAREWGTARGIGRALRVAAMAESGEQQVELLNQAVAVLGDSTARLEQAWAGLALGDALRRAKRFQEARPLLQSALELAEFCGAEPLKADVVTTLSLMGTRPAAGLRRGRAGLTPGEVRVVDLATTGLSNKEIAQNLFVTVKTVEVHLSNAFRKLGISRRGDLVPALDRS